MFPTIWSVIFSRNVFADTFLTAPMFHRPLSIFIRSDAKLLLERLDEHRLVAAAGGEADLFYCEKSFFEQLGGLLEAQLLKKLLG